MTVEEPAEFLFVSRGLIRKLMERGAPIDVLPSRPNDKVNAAPFSTQAFRTKQSSTQRTYCDSQTEGYEPHMPIAGFAHDYAI